MNRHIVLAVAAAGALALSAYAVAAGSDPIPSYSGCLKNGKLESLAIGDAPIASCSSGSTQVRLSGGDITGVSAGFGLRGGGDNGNLILTVDASTMQRRVSGRCNGNLLSDASITAINDDGSVVCNSDDTGPSTDVFSGFYDGPVDLPDANPQPQPIAQLPLPPGKYAIVATLNLGSPSEFGVAVECQLSAGADIDKGDVIMDEHAEEPIVETRQTLQVVHAFAAPGAAVVSCSSFIAGGFWSLLKITATRVANLSNQPLTLLP
jgi:hypothetical protein